MVLEKTLESPLDCKKIQLVHPEEDKSWVFIGRTVAEAETPVLWPLHVKSANQNHNEVPLHASQDGCYRKVYKLNAGECVEKREPSYTVGGNAN